MLDIKKLSQFYKEYIWNMKWVKILISPMIVLMIIANYIEILATKYITNLSQMKGPDDFPILGCIFLMMVIQNTFKYIVSIFTAYFISSNVRKAYFNFFYEYLNIEYYEFIKHGVGEAHYNIQRKSIALSDFFTSVTLHFIENFVFFIIVIVMVLRKLNFLLGLKVLIAISLFLFVVIYSQGIRSKIRRKANDGLQMNLKKLFDVLINYERIISYDNENVEVKKYYDIMEEQTIYTKIFWVTYELSRYLTDLMFLFLSFYIYSAYKESNIANEYIQASVSELSGYIKKLEGKMKILCLNLDNFCTHYTNFEQSMIKNADLENESDKMKICGFEKDLVFKNLALYQGEKMIFSNVNLLIEKGEKIAITGVNGSGKSTFLKIILGLYKYNGNIEIDGLLHETIDKHSLRETIAYVSQDSQLFDTTILKNLQGSKNVPPEEIYEKCKLFNYHTLFKTLGYTKRVGSRGKSISGGQRQKISFMRAIIKNAPIILLDEPTSNLDKVSEITLVENLIKKTQGTTVLMIVHSLETLKHFDKIIFFANHTLDGKGSFNDLYQNNERFRNFYLQSNQTNDLL
ncbi:hypothetical protein NUSPORA_00090 [Nucleospora cyclopteri]